MKIVLIFICVFFVGCNYSYQKTGFKEGLAGLELLPPGTIVSYQVLENAILRPKCLECHSGAGEGGVNLETYEEVSANLDFIKSAVENDSMPKNRPKLTSKEKEILVTWILAGAPRDVEFIPFELVREKVLRPSCIGCHSVVGGNRGNVNLETYENIVGMINQIERAVESGSMPRPPGRPLTQEQKELILKWIKNGAPNK